VCRCAPPRSYNCFVPPSGLNAPLSRESGRWYAGETSGENATKLVPSSSSIVSPAEEEEDEDELLEDELLEDDEDDDELDDEDIPSTNQSILVLINIIDYP